MKIIRRQPNPSGAYPPPQTWSGASIPDGYVVISDDVDLTDFYSHNGFVTLETEGDVVTGYALNTEAWQAWKAAQPEAEEPPVDDLTALRLAVAELAEAQAADMLDVQLAIAELAEAFTGGE
jgi:hypothetical protein